MYWTQINISPFKTFYGGSVELNISGKYSTSFSLVRRRLSMVPFGISLIEGCCKRGS
jgi:hypothetical protein